MWKYLLILLLSLPLLSQEVIWKERPEGGKFLGYEMAKDSAYGVDYFYATPNNNGTVYTSKEFSLHYWEGQLNSTLQIDSVTTALSDTLRLVVWLDIWDGVGWVAIKVTWDTLKTVASTYDSLSAYQDTLIFTAATFNTLRFYFSTTRILSNTYLGFLDMYYSRIRWRLEFLDTGSSSSYCYLKQTFNYWQKGK